MGYACRAFPLRVPGLAQVDEHRGVFAVERDPPMLVGLGVLLPGLEADLFDAAADRQDPVAALVETLVGGVAGAVQAASMINTVSLTDAGCGFPFSVGGGSTSSKGLWVIQRALGVLLCAVELRVDLADRPGLERDADVLLAPLVAPA